MTVNFVRQDAALSAAVAFLFSLGVQSQAQALPESQTPEDSSNQRLTASRTPVSGGLVDPSDHFIGANVTLPGKAALISWVDTGVHPWAAILCIHGLGFHKETYSALAKRLSRLGIAMYAIDVRGFGVYKERNPHARVDFERSFVDIKEALTTIKQNNQQIPVFLLGESMGGAMALQAAARYPELVNGAASSVPAFNTVRNLPLSMKVMMIGALRGPNGQVSIAGDVVGRSTHKEHLKQEMLDDPATRHHMSVRDLLAYRKLMGQNNKAIKKLSGTPIFLVQGYKDKLVGPRSTTNLFNHIATADKDMFLVGKSDHLVFEEGQFSDETVDTLVSWLSKHSDGGAPFALLPSQLSKMNTPVQAYVGSTPVGSAAAAKPSQTTSEVLDKGGRNQDSKDQ